VLFDLVPSDCTAFATNLQNLPITYARGHYWDFWADARLGLGHLSVVQVAVFLPHVQGTLTTTMRLGRS
jgi:hypothetical protein